MIDWMVLLIILFGVIYYYFTRNYGYFSKHNIPELPSSFPFGSAPAWNVMTGKKSFLNMLHSIYEQYKLLPVVGHVFVDKPLLLINDIELVKNILIKDFDHFTDRRVIELNTKVRSNKIFMSMMSVVNGDTWRRMRTTMSPVFTSGKLKAMTPLLAKVGRDLEQNLSDKSKSGADFLMKDTMVDYMLDSIAACGFGVESKTLTEGQNHWKTNVDKFTGGGAGSRDPRVLVRMVIVFFLPKIANLFKMTFVDEDAVDFFVNVIKQTMEHRKTTKVKRNDFVDLTLDALRNEIKNEVEDDQFERDAQLKVKSEMSKLSESELEPLLVANLLLFFIAGFDTSSTVLSIASYFLAKHQDIQDRLLDEINDELTDEDIENLDYNKAHSLPYLDQFVNETLRLYPLTPIERRCSKPYPLPGTNLVIPEGMLVQVATSGIMRDPRYYDNPDVFDPDHFSPENVAKRNPYTFLAFGQGPRNCIGMRFALMSVKICLIRLVKNFKVLPSPKMPDQLEPDPLSRSGQPRGGVWIKVEKRS